MKRMKHHGIEYERIKHWHLFNNEYKMRQDYSIQTDIYGYTIVDNPEGRGNIRLLKSGELTIGHGFWWNGPSGPTYDSKNFMRGSLIHDALYRLMRVGLLPLWYRAYADELLYKLCREDGMSKFRARYVLKGVHEGGLDSALPGGGDI